MNKTLQTASDEITQCPIFKTIELFQGKWNVWILFELSRHGRMRFGELKKAIPGISNTMLSATLKALEAKHLIARQQFNEVPPHVEYYTTEATKALCSVFSAMEQWGGRYMTD